MNNASLSGRGKSLHEDAGSNGKTGTRKYKTDRD